MTEFHQARIRAEWQDWTFGAHQAAARAAAAEDLIALRRQYTELSEPDVLRLAHSWRSDDTSGPYFIFTAADVGGEPPTVLVDAVFTKALFHELDDQAPAALAQLIARWTEQRAHAAYAGLHPTPAQPPRVTLLIPHDESQWPPDSWQNLQTLPLDAPQFDRTLLHWDSSSGLWSLLPITPPNPFGRLTNPPNR